MPAAMGPDLSHAVSLLVPGALVLAAVLAYLIHRLREQERHLTQWFEQAPDAVALIAKDDRVIRVNKGFTQVFAYTPQAALGRRLSQLIVPAEGREAHLKSIDLAAQGQRVDTQGIGCRQDHSRLPVAITLAPFSTPGQEIAVYAIYRDITEQQRTEEARQSSEGRWRAIFDNSAVGISVTDSHGKFIATNWAYQEMVGYAQEELRAMTYIDVTHEEDRAASVAVAADNWAGRRPQFQLEKRYRRKDGQTIWVRVTVSKTSGSGATPEIGIAVVEEITERKRAEEARAASEQVWRAIFDNSVVGIGLADRHGRITAANRAFQEMVGYSEEELRAMTYIELTHEEDRGLNAALSEEMWADRSAGFPMEKRYLHKDGRPIWVRATISKSPGDGRMPPFAICVAEDITERKRAEARLLDYERVVEGLQEMIVVIGRDYRFLIANRAFLKHYGMRREQVAGHLVSELVGQEMFEKHSKSRLDECLRGRVLKYNLAVDFPQLGRRDISASYFPIEGPAGIDRIAVVMEDITERKRAEARLLEYQKVVENSQEMMAVVDRDYRYLIANQAFLNYRDLQPEQVIGHLVPEVLGREPFEHIVKPKLDECFGGRVVKYEMPYTYAKAGRRDLYVKYFPIEGSAGVDRIAAVLEDITDRKRAEARLLEFEKVVESLEENIVVVDREYRYLIANRAFLEYRDLQLEDINGRLVPEIVGQEFFERVVKSKLDECFQGSIVKYEMEFMHPKLGRRDLAATYLPIEGATGVDRVAGVLEDITERKRAERELQRSFQELHALNGQLQSVREEERTRLARELHDELGQALTAIKIDLAALKAAPGHAQQAQSIDGTLRLVDETIHSVRRISTELRPSVLDHLGLVAAVEWAAAEFQERTGIRCRVNLPETHRAIEPERATALFRIFQETLTNIARHAGATEVRIDLRQPGGNLELEVSDNGHGISEAQRAGPGSLGILGMRERALLMGGEFTIAGNSGKGTAVRVRIPAERRQMGGAS